MFGRREGMSAVPKSRNGGAVVDGFQERARGTRDVALDLLKGGGEGTVTSPGMAWAVGRGKSAGREAGRKRVSRAEVPPVGSARGRCGSRFAATQRSRVSSHPRAAFMAHYTL